jgi:hypothetical protein
MRIWCVWETTPPPPHVSFYAPATAAGSIMTSGKNWRSISGSTERLNDGGVDGVIGSHKWQGKKYIYRVATGGRRKGKSKRKSITE